MRLQDENTSRISDDVLIVHLLAVVWNQLAIALAGQDDAVVVVLEQETS